MALARPLFVLSKPLLWLRRVLATLRLAHPPLTPAVDAAEAALAELIADAETALGMREAAPASGPDALAAEAASQGAFNEETGEINWDCPVSAACCPVPAPAPAAVKRKCACCCCCACCCPEGMKCCGA